jgi:hypothetical protein
VRKFWRLAVAPAIGFCVCSVALAQSQSLASTMNVYVFPAEGQEPSQQSRDEADCYEWAVGNVGADPFDLSKEQQANERQAAADQQAAAQAGQGAGARGAVGGAVAGALIGEIADTDASEAAAWGAALGAMRGRRAAAAQRQQAQQQAASQAQQREQATGEQMANFKKAFSVCLEAKEYMVRY